MNCPNCHSSFEGDPKYCPSCGHPLSNADYGPVSPETIEKKKKKRKHVFLVIFSVIMVLGIAGVIGYNYYLSQVRSRCEEVVNQIFTVAHDMDFSSVDPAYLPDELKENPDIKSLITKYLTEALGNDQYSGIVTYVTDVIGIDKICDDIIDSAQYEIVSTKADYKSCKVTVKTSNTDYSKMVQNMIQKAKDKLSGEDSGFWETIGSYITSFFTGKETSKEGEADIKELILDIYEEAKADTERISETGTIEFGIVGKEWTLTNLDMNLFYTYYGILSFVEPAGSGK